MRNNFVSRLFVGVGVVLMLGGCSSKNADETGTEIVNQLPTDVVVPAETAVVDDKPVNKNGSAEEERVDIEVPEKPVENDKLSVPNANRSSYSLNEVKFFDGLDTGSFTLQVNKVSGEDENLVMSMDIRADRRTEIVKIDTSIVGVDETTTGISAYIDVGNAVSYLNNGSGWTGSVNDSGIDEIESLNISNMFGTDWTFDRTDEYFAYFKKTGNSAEVITTMLEDASVGYTLISGEMKVNRETLRMVDLTQIGVVSKFNSDSGENDEVTYVIKSSIQDINGLGTIMLPSEISDNVTVDTTKSNAIVYD